jgi:hypothetical protein
LVNRAYQPSVAASASRALQSAEPERHPAHAAWRSQDYLEVANRAAALGVGVIGLRPLAGGALGCSTADPSHPGEAELAADRIKGRRFDFLVDDPSLLPRLAIRFALSQNSGGLSAGGGL